MEDSYDQLMDQVDDSRKMSLTVDNVMNIVMREHVPYPQVFTFTIYILQNI